MRGTTYLSAWRQPWFAATIAAIVAVAAKVQNPIAIPGRDDVFGVVAPLLPMAVAFPLIAALPLFASSTALRSSRSPQALRAAFVGVTIAWCALAAVLIGFVGHDQSDWIQFRNGLFAMGAVFAAHRLGVGAEVGALAIVTYGSAALILGTRPGSQPPAPWAFVLHDGQYTPAAIASVVALAVGATLFIFKPQWNNS